MRLRLFWEKCLSTTRISLAIAMVLTMTGHAHAQFAGATLTGPVTDSFREVISNVQVTINDVETDVALIIFSNAVGPYIAANLPNR
jgi:hypothetical protein